MSERYLKVLRFLESVLGMIFFAGFIIVIYAAIYPSIIAARLEQGMQKEFVLSAVGKEPLWDESTLEFCARHIWSGDCEQANTSDAVNFLIWKLGIDVYLVVGLDKESRLVFKGIGDT